MNTAPPLVSIIVITYNSAKFVLETLESAKAQTYQNIELIISDDASTDETIELCRKWVLENRARFVRSEIITVSENSGIPANCNRGVSVAEGDWVKLIAGDDKILPDCITSNVNWVLSKPDIKTLFSLSKRYFNTFDEDNLQEVLPVLPSDFFNDKITAKEQFYMLLLSNKIRNTGTAFICTKVLKDIGQFDLRYIYTEDYAMWVKLTKAGYKLHFMNKPTHQYRIHDSNISNLKANTIVRPFFIRDEFFRTQEIYPHLNVLHFLKMKHHYYIAYAFYKTLLNKDNAVNRFIYRMLLKYLNPIWYLINILKLFGIKINHVKS